MTKWLYNGTELPALPENVQEYTYIYVTTWQLVYSNEYPIDNLDTGDWPLAYIKDNPNVLDLSQDKESWIKSDPAEVVFVTDLPIWANFNVLNDNGSIYLEASTPVIPEVETTVSDFEYSTIRAQQQGYEIKLARPNVEPWELKANYDISTRSDRIITAQVRYFPRLNDYRLFILGAGNCANERPWIQEYGDKITYVKIENPVRQIPNAFLSGCTNVSQVVLPLQFGNGLHLLPFTIPEDAFKGCTSLSTINISNGTNIIEDRAFEGCNSLLKINLPNAVTSIGQSAFQDSGLRSVVIGRGITSLSENIFKGTNLTDKITIPNNVERINKDAFASISAFPKVFIPASVTEIPDCICDQSDNIQFYCEASEKPEGWNDNWNTVFAAFGLKAPVTWGISPEDFKHLKE